MDSETSSSRVRFVENLVAEHEQRQRTRAAWRQTISMDVPDPNYGAFDLLKTGISHPGTGISRLYRSISQFFHRISLTLLLIFTGPSILIEPNTPRKVFAVEDIYPMESGLIFRRSNTTTRTDLEEDHLWSFGGKR